MKRESTMAMATLRLGWLALALGLAAPLAVAQDTAEQDSEEELALEEVIVTGSRIKRNPADQMAPIGTIGTNGSAIHRNASR